jgi:hypothetical protein
MRLNIMSSVNVTEIMRLGYKKGWHDDYDGIDALIQSMKLFAASQFATLSSAAI